MAPIKGYIIIAATMLAIYGSWFGWNHHQYTSMINKMEKIIYDTEEYYLWVSDNKVMKTIEIKELISHYFPDLDTKAYVELFDKMANKKLTIEERVQRKRHEEQRRKEKDEYMKGMEKEIDTSGIPKANEN